MKKDEIIVLLKEQLQLANEQLQQANATVSSLTTQVNELIERIKSLEELLVQKGIAIDKANRQNLLSSLRFFRNYPVFTALSYSKLLAVNKVGRVKIICACKNVRQIFAVWIFVDRT